MTNTTTTQNIPQGMTQGIGMTNPNKTDDESNTNKRLQETTVEKTIDIELEEESCSSDEDFDIELPARCKEAKRLERLERLELEEVKQIEEPRIDNSCLLSNTPIIRTVAKVNRVTPKSPVEKNKDNEEKIEAVRSFTSGFTKVLPKDDAIRMGLSKETNNGSGNRHLIHKLFNVIHVYGDKKKHKPYASSEVVTPEDMHCCDVFKEEYKGDKKTAAVIGYKILKVKDTKPTSHPIRKDIVQKITKGQECVVCGCKNDLECDHKNDLYNDPRVNNTSTQTVDDFQCLCSHCNKQKRQVSVETKQSGKRYSAMNIPSMKAYGIGFIQGGETFDINDPNAMVGTYWYDCIAFSQVCANNKNIT